MAELLLFSNPKLCIEIYEQNIIKEFQIILKNKKLSDHLVQNKFQ